MERKTCAFCLSGFLLLVISWGSYAANPLVTNVRTADPNPPGFDSSYADVDCNGNIDIVDALMTAQYYVRLFSSLNC